MRNLLRALGRLCAGALLLPLLLPASLAHAQASAYPNKPLRFIVPYPPGGIGDTYARALGQHLSERLGQPVVIDNKPGGSQIIGAEAAAKSPGDGYTLFLGSTSSLVLNTASRKNLPYDPVKDFAPVSLVFNTPLYLVVNPELPVKSVKDLIALAKAKPGTLSFASIGNGSSVHLAGELFKSMAGIDIFHVPYKGSSPALTDIMSGRVQMMFDGGASALPQVKAGKLRLLAVTDSKRQESMPDVPTMAEAGVPGYEAVFWFGVVTTAGTPRPVVDRLAREIADISKLPAFKERFATSGFDLVTSTPDAMAELIKRDIPKWTKIISAAGIVAE